MGKRVIYKTPEGGAAIIVPAEGCGLTLEQIAAKDVPFGSRFKIVDETEIPPRDRRATFNIPDEQLTDGVGADYGAGSQNEVIGYRPDGSPITRGRSAAVRP